MSYKHQGLTNQHLKVAAVPWGPFLVWKCPGDSEWIHTYFRECPNGEERLYKGVLWDLLSFMQRARNCKFTFDITYQDWYGNCYESDNCTGMIGQANRGEVDLALGTLAFKGPFTPSPLDTVLLECLVTLLLDERSLR